MYNGEGLYKNATWRDSVTVKIFAVLMRAVRGITYCQHPPSTHGGPRFRGKGSNFYAEKIE